jgi:predicted LPLAT superfamily acyltransferase
MNTQSTEEARTAEQVAWLTRQERGALSGIRAVFWLARAFGRRPAQLVLRIVALWYVLGDRAARESSRVWLTRVHGKPASFAAIYNHLYTFACVTLDRVFLLMGEYKKFDVKPEGSHHLRALVTEKRGAVLVGAHLGSFEAMRARGADQRFPINIVGHFENARMINSLLAVLNPELSARVIHVGKDPVGFATQVRERLEAGEMVAILADRVGLNDKQIEVPFLGEKAAFPTGPFLLAHALKCPVYLTFGLYFAPNRYEIFCEPFAERISLPRGQREQALREVVERYAARLEYYARRAPNNWFNFYDFWKTRSP